MADRRLIESDDFPFEFLSRLGERESWRKEVHRPIYHVHKWWAKRLGTIFRGMLLGCALDEGADLSLSFYMRHAFSGLTVFDPFMGSGTTIGEAHKLGCRAIGRDINPVAVESVRTALGPLDRRTIRHAFAELSEGVGETVRGLYQSEDSRGRACDVLYYFWVMQAACPDCGQQLDLFPSYIIARNACPEKNAAVQVLCPSCGHILPGTLGQTQVACGVCGFTFNPEQGTVKVRTANCSHCDRGFAILDAIGGKRPSFRLYGKLVLRRDGEKEYLSASPADISAYAECSRRLQQAVAAGDIHLPDLTLQDGYNTRQAMRYGFLAWRDFFNDRQLLALSLLRSAITKIADLPTRHALVTLFSGVLEFNNMFASYKGEGTGAVRHMFSHHILKPERTPIEANVWGTPKSSGSFSNLFRSRLLRAIDYRETPTEVNGTGSAAGRVCSPPFTGELHSWGGPLPRRAISLSCGDSAATGLADRSVDLIVTDPPFFDNVHYSELADFFFAWQRLSNSAGTASTRHECEVQDASAGRFSRKLEAVFSECRRVLTDYGLLVFTYHHSRSDGWEALAGAILRAGFVVVNAHPVKSEMSVATPKSQAKEPIQLDIVVVCRKATAAVQPAEVRDALASAKTKIERLCVAGFRLSRNDQRVVLFGQLLTTLTSASDVDVLAGHVEDELAETQSPAIAAHRSMLLFQDD
jgi:putative DNA methylase